MVSRLRRTRVLVPGRRALVSVFLVAFCAIAVASWRPQAQNQRKAGAAEPVARVNLRPDAEGADYGTTFHTFEARATAVRTRFANATAIADRSVDGDVRVQLHDTVGNDVAKLTVHRQSHDRTDLEFDDGAGVIETAAAQGIVPTLNWANRQAYALWNDRALPGDAIEWRGRLARAATGRRQIGELREVRTEFAGGIVATTSGDAPAAARNSGPQPSFVTSITVEEVEVGKMAWYAREQLLAWNFPGLTTGSVDTVKLQPLGGWHFTPTMAWANVQALAVYDLHTRLKFEGKVAQRQGSPWLERLAGFIAPTLHAQNGCDGLHYFDDTVFRPCCDVHDRCYATYGCTGSSWWWPFGARWECTGCNLTVLWCFKDGGCSYDPCWDVPNR
jgi:hypothetical protein